MPREIATVPTTSLGRLVGIQQVVQVPQPAAGAEWTYTLPGGYFYRLLSGTAILTNSAVVASRFPGLRLSDGANVLGAFTDTSSVTASLIGRVSYGPGIPAGGVAGPKGALMVPFYGGWIPASYVLTSSTTGMDVGDQYSAIVLWLECLDFGALGTPEGVHRLTQSEADDIYPAHQ